MPWPTHAQGFVDGSGGFPASAEEYGGGDGSTGGEEAALTHEWERTVRPSEWSARTPRGVASYAVKGPNTKNYTALRGHTQTPLHPPPEGGLVRC